MIRLVIIDLIPALLREGRDSLEPHPETVALLDDLFSNYRLAAVTDVGTHGDIRRVMSHLELDRWFESIGTTVEFGPHLTAIVVRRLASTVGVTPNRVVVLTGRPGVAEVLSRGGIRVLLLDDDTDYATVVRQIGQGPNVTQ